MFDHLSAAFADEEIAKGNTEQLVQTHILVLGALALICNLGEIFSS